MWLFSHTENEVNALVNQWSLERNEKKINNWWNYYKDKISICTQSYIIILTYIYSQIQLFWVNLNNHTVCDCWIWGNTRIVEY